MIREIVIPESNEYTLQIPSSFIGKKIETLALEVEDQPVMTPAEKSGKTLFDQFKDLTFDSKGTYTFDRDEATDYH